MSLGAPSRQNDTKHYNDAGDAGGRRFWKLLCIFNAFVMGGIVSFVLKPKLSETAENQYSSSSLAIFESPTTKTSPSAEDQYSVSSLAQPEFPATKRSPSIENQYSSSSQDLSEGYASRKHQQGTHRFMRSNGNMPQQLEQYSDVSQQQEQGQKKGYIPHQNQYSVSASSLARPTTQFFDSKVRFIFTVGLEGTGHHAMSELIKISPSAQKIEEVGIAEFVAPLSQLLYDRENIDGLYNAHCKFCQSKKCRAVEKTAKAGEIRFSNTQGEVNVKSVLVSVVETLKEIERKAAEASSSTKGKQIIFPVNGWSPIKGEIADIEMVSYPNFNIECRKLDYPNVDLFYQACELAEVDCQHQYIYRDPSAILMSTKQREFNRSPLEGMHLYTTFLKVIFALLSTHGPDRTAGCFGILEPKDNDNDLWKAGLGRLLGWKSKQAFQSAWDDVMYVPKPNPGEVEEQSFERFDPFMKSFYRAHQDVLALCKAHMKAKGNTN